MTKAEKTRQYIIEKTAPIFNTKGFAGTSMSDITEATGLTKGSIYGNFDNKDEVALAALDHNLAMIKAAIAEALSKKKTAREKLRAYVAVYDDFLKHPFLVGGCPILNTATDADDTHPALKKKVCDAIVSWKGNIMKIVEGGMANGEFKADTDAEQFALTLIAMIEGSIMIRKATGKLNYGRLIIQSVEKMINDL